MNSEEFTTLELSQVSVGETARVLRFKPGFKDYRQKLLAMGLTPGTSFRVIRKAPLGDPLQLEVRGFSLSLRKGEASCIYVERVSA